MTEKEKKAIEYFKERIDIYSENANICDENGFDEEAIQLREEQAFTETILNLIQSRQQEIERLKKVLDERFIYVTGARTVYDRLMSLDKEIIVKDDLKLRNEINQDIKEIEKKDEIINVQVDFLYRLGTDIPGTVFKRLWDEGLDKEKCGRCRNDNKKCEDCIKQYFEKKVEGKK